MKTLQIAILISIITTITIFADSYPYSYVVPIKIYFNDKTSKIVWTEYSTEQFNKQNPEMRSDAEKPIPGGALYYVNKFGGDSLTYSEKYFKAPLGRGFLIAKKMSLKNVVCIVDASFSTNDTLQNDGVWVNPWLDREIGIQLLNKKPVFQGKIVTEEEACWNAEEFYSYDPAFTEKRIRALYAKGGRENPELMQAMKLKKIILLEEVGP